MTVMTGGEAFHMADCLSFFALNKIEGALSQLVRYKALKIFSDDESFHDIFFIEFQQQEELNASSLTKFLPCLTTYVYK